MNEEIFLYVVQMKGRRKYRRELEYDYDSSCHMADLDKGVQKIVTDVPDQRTSVVSWIILTGLFIIFLVVIMYLVLRFESPENPNTTVKDTALYRSSAFHAPKLQVTGRLKTRELCSALSNDLYLLEPMGYVSEINRQMSKLMTLDINSGDVHYVFSNNTHVPWLFMCSIESALNAVNNNSRVNVFIVDGIEFQRPVYDGQNMVCMLNTFYIMNHVYIILSLIYEFINNILRLNNMITLLQFDRYLLIE